MVNHLNEKNKNGAIIAAVVSALVVLIAGLTAALVLTLQSHSRHAEPRIDQPVEPRMSQYLLVDAAAGLKQTTSALRLSNSEVSASGTAQQALVYATRAETALECEENDWDAGSDKEAFLNDAAALLSRKSPMRAVEKADELYRLSAALYDSLNGNGEFAYNGELGEQADDAQIDAGDPQAAAELVKSVIGGEPQNIGSYDGRHEFAIDIDGENGYATVKDGRIIEFSFSHDGSDGDPAKAEQLALETAKNCGFDDLYVYSIEKSDGVLSVKMCCACRGALCRDECAVAVVSGDKVKAFTAGKCGTHHDLPSVKYTEAQARENAVGGGEGRLVTLNDGERDRICYEYRYELDDGEHFVYVCAENGKQMSLR